MGKLNDGVFGAFTGRVGNVVGYAWRGMDLIRKRPKRRSRNSATERQLEQRERFALAVKFLTPMKEVVGAHFGRPLKSKSRFNLAVSYNVVYGIIPVLGGGFTLDYPRVMISKGDLRGMESGAVTPLVGSVLQLDWTDNSGQGSAKDTDVMVAVMYSPDQELYQLFNPAALRGDASVSLTMPAYFSGKEVHVWTAMVSDDLKVASVSSYLGTAVVT